MIRGPRVSSIQLFITEKRMTPGFYHSLIRNRMILHRPQRDGNRAVIYCSTTDP